LTEPNNGLPGRHILIVEDELLIAWSIKAIVESLGCVVLGPVSSVNDAFELLRSNVPDAALLDVNLHGESVMPLAEECQLRKIPFALVTGYGRLRLSDSLLNAAVRVRKPFNTDDVAKALASVVRTATDQSRA
jgi:DNA-binding NtrC family response regulator